jgi:hypothetical protein
MDILMVIMEERLTFYKCKSAYMKSISCYYFFCFFFFTAACYEDIGLWFFPFLFYRLTNFLFTDMGYEVRILLRFISYLVS